MPPCPAETPPSPAQRGALALLRGYRLLLSPLLGQRCRFHPSCSHFAGEAILRFGVLRGGLLTMFRVGRCQPLCEGGHDPVPPAWPARPWRRPQAGPTDGAAP